MTEKKAKADSKVFDVNKPGKSAPSASSKPIIITNRPVLQDPMMVGDGSQEESAQPSAPSLPSQRIKIEPIHLTSDNEPVDPAPATPKPKPAGKSIETLLADHQANKTEAKAPEPSPSESGIEPVKTTATPAENIAEPAPETPEQAEATVETKSEIKAEADKSTEASPDAAPEPSSEVAEPPAAATDKSEAAEPPTISKSETEEEAASTTADEPEVGEADTSTKGNEEGSDTATSPTSTPKSPLDKKGEAALEAATAKRNEEIDELVESHKYYLPINQVEKRKNKRYALLGALLIVLLGIAWADIALDAGIIHISGVKPLTHLFGSTHTPAAATVPTPVAGHSTTATYTSPIDGFSFTYPSSSWKLTTAATIPDSASLSAKSTVLAAKPVISLERNPQTTAPSGQTSTVSTVADVSYQKLSKSSTSAPLYLQQFIVKNQAVSSTYYLLYINVTATINSLQVGQQIKGGSTVIDSQAFKSVNGKDTLEFNGVVLVHGKLGFPTLQTAQDYTKNDVTFQQAKNILLSFSPGK